MRVAAELSGLRTLALEWAAAVCAVSDEARMDLVRVAVLCPADTPYMNGVAFVDLRLPADYPASPPQAKFVSTAGGSVRFNPNLYAEGKVCLSLLGTWAGPGWEPGKSTLAQLLLAIQGQILNPNPWMNEPGHTAAPASCRGYNAVLRLATLQTLIMAPLESPPAHFAEVAARHFWCKRREIARQCDQWAAAARECAAAQQSTPAKPYCTVARQWAGEYHVFAAPAGLDGNMRAVADKTATVAARIKGLLSRMTKPAGL